MQHWWENRHMEQQDTTETLEIDPKIYRLFIFDKKCPKKGKKRENCGFRAIGHAQANNETQPQSHIL